MVPIKATTQCVLFVGSFLSNTKGTMGVAEKLKGQLESDYCLYYASSRVNKFARLFDITLHLFFKKYDVLHCDVFSGQSFWVADFARRVALLRRKKVILNLRGGRLIDVLEVSSRRRRILSNWGKSQLSIITPSRFLSKEIQRRWGLDIEIIPNFINLNKFPYLGAPRIGYRLLWVRSFKAIYQPQHAVQALAILLKSYKDVTLTMVGPDGGNLGEVERLIEDLGVKEKVKIVAKVSNEELYKYYHSHDVYLNTTSYESFGLAVLEAAACGIPIVSNRVGELPLMWESGSEIIFTDKQTGDSFARAIENLFQDRHALYDQQLAARLRASQYSWRQIGPMWQKLLSV